MRPRQDLWLILVYCTSASCCFMVAKTPFVSCLQSQLIVSPATTCFHYSGKTQRKHYRLVALMTLNHLTAIHLLRYCRAHYKPASRASQPVLNVDIRSPGPIRVDNPKKHKVVNDEDRHRSTRQV
ncbi:hypothetical protein QBC45DRAFT_416942 [Copromyces sp. CBS 386.78]|nr:hypothetical protein QBC45DRAFT_416942 [Copromyces sp. CBS 386.78]